MHWQKITLAGVGLLGGSLGLALRKARLAETVVGLVRRQASVAECQALGAVDVATCDLRAAVEGAGLVVLCTPLGRMRPLVEQMLPGLEPGAVVTDVGSVKGPVVRELEGLVAGAGGHFIGGHPMAGAEKTGVAAAQADLFWDAVCVLTPTANSHLPALGQVRALWDGLGAKVLELTPQCHDKLVSRSSHLPHVLAAQLASLILSPEYPPEQRALCANGFRDTTRIASGSPEMWLDIALANRENLCQALRRFTLGLQDFSRALEAGDAQAIAGFFETAKQRRDDWSGNRWASCSE
ncbi:MAG: prephenate dehydrogenase [Limisphaerales bacterium]